MGGGFRCWEGVEIFLTSLPASWSLIGQHPSMLASDWSAPPYLLVCKNPAMSLIGQLQFVIITVCACAHSTLLPSKNLYVLHTCTVYAVVLRTCAVYAIILRTCTVYAIELRTCIVYAIVCCTSISVILCIIICICTYF